MSVVPAEAIPVMHMKLAEARRYGENMRALAVQLAEALDAEVDLRIGARDDDVYVRRQTSRALVEARLQGAL